MNKKRSIISLLIILMSLLTLTAVYADTATVTEVTVKDTLGRDVTVVSPPDLAIITGKKTATISEVPLMFKNSFNHLIVPTGGQDKGAFMKLIGELGSDVPALADSNVETVAALKPDLIILKGYTREDAGIAFEQTGIPVMYMNFETLDDYKTDIANLGQVFAEEERAEEIISYYQNLVDSVSAKTKDIATKKKVLLLQYAVNEGVYALKAAPVGWMQTSLVEWAGGDPVWKDAGLKPNAWTDVNFEQIAAWDPEVILIVDYFSDPYADVQKLKGEKGWDQLSAVKNGQIFAFGKDTLSWDSSSPRWGLGLLWTFKTLYPELAADIDLKKEMLSFYSEFGLSEETIQKGLVDVVHDDVKRLF